MKSTTKDKISNTEGLSTDPTISNTQKINYRSLFYPFILFDGIYKGYSLNLFDEIVVFTLLLKKAPELKGFSLLNWFVSQVLSSSILVVIKVKVLSCIKKIKKSYYTGLLLIFVVEIILAAFGLYFGKYQLYKRIKLFYNSRYYCYMFYIFVKVTQNTLEFVHGTIINRLLDYVMLNVINHDESGLLIEDTEKISENKLAFLSKRERCSIGFKVLGTLFYTWARPGYFYYLITQEDIFFFIIKRFIMVLFLNLYSLWLVTRIDEKDILSASAQSNTHTQAFFKSLIGTVKLIKVGILDLFKKVDPLTVDKKKISSIRTSIFLLLSFGHTFFGCILIDKIKSHIVKGNSEGLTDLYFNMSYSSFIQVLSITILVMISQEAESIWVSLNYKRETYHKKMVFVYITGLINLVGALYFKLLNPYQVLMGYNVLNFSTRAINLKILLKKETTLETQDALNLWNEIFDGVTLFISLGLEFFSLQIEFYIIIFIISIMVYTRVLCLFLYYNERCPPLDIISELGYNDNKINEENNSILVKEINDKEESQVLKK